MRISFQTTETGQNTEKWKKTDREAQVQRIGTESSYTLDISGTVKDNEIYRGHGKTTEEVMQEAGMQDVALTRDYMAVMSNSMSDEEFAKLQEDGYRPGDMEIENAVTIVDQIKASLLQAGVSVNGYTDTLDMGTLTEITGNEALAQNMTKAFSEAGVPLTEETAKAAMQALEEAGNLTQPGEDAVKYMVLNDKEPVIQDFYMAQYSSRMDGSRQGRGYYQDENGYLSRKADTIDMSQLQPQIDRIIEDAGLADYEGAESAAKWLIEAGLPLTKDTLISYMELSKVSFPVEQSKLLSAMAAAVADGKAPKQANLTGEGSLWRQAFEIWQKVQSISNEAADFTAEQGKSLTLYHLQQTQQQLGNGYVYSGNENITARRQLEEVRLQMTIAANRELLKSGYAIETMQLEKLVEALKDVENRQNQIVFGGNSLQETSVRAQLYTETLSIVSKTAQMPLAVVGKVCTIVNGSGIDITEKSSAAGFTLEQVNAEGEALKAAYQKAGERYETLWTKPDSELGDSIKKAFQNADVLLRELGMEATESNLRAIRILGYNHLDITQENVLTVKAADSALGNVIKKMTPAAVLQMIREEKNPLNMTVEELDNYLAGQQQESEAEQEKFSKFLYKLEQKKEISEEEKESYIGIFRLIRQIEKTDGAVIGSLMHQGAELSFRNLLTAVRTYRSKPIDAVADDEHGTIKELSHNGSRIDEQIESYYKSLSHEIYHELDGDKVAEIAPDMETDLEAFAEQLRRAQADEQNEFSYRRQQIELFRETQNISEKQITFLHMVEEPVTLQNLKAAEKFRQNLSKAFMKIRKEADTYKSNEKNAFQNAVENLEEQFTDREEAISAYRKLADTEKDILENAMYESEQITSLDVKELGLIYKQISFTAKLADTEQYEIPIVTENSVTAMHLQIVHSEKEKGSIEVSIELEQYGQLSARVQVQGGEINGIFLDAQKENKEALSDLKQQIETCLTESGFGLRKINAFSRDNVKDDSIQTSTGELYKAAKAMIGVMRRQAERG